MNCAFRGLTCAGSQCSCPQEPTQCVQTVLYPGCLERTVSCCPRAKALLEEAGPGCVISSHGPWPYRGGWNPVSCWCFDPVIYAHPEASSAHQLLPFAFSCCPFQPVLPNPAFSVCSPLLLPFLPSSLSPLFPFTPLLLNLYFFFSVPAKRYQSR